MIKAYKDYMIGEKKSMNTINAYCSDVQLKQILNMPICLIGNPALAAWHLLLSIERLLLLKAILIF